MKIKGSRPSTGSFDLIRVWFKSEGARVPSAKPYGGPLAHPWPEGARIIGFQSNTPKGVAEMTVGDDDVFEVVQP